MIIKTPDDLKHLRTAGKLLAEALRETALLVREGQTTAALDIAAERYIRDHGAVPAFLGYKPRGARIPFPAVLCVSINDEVVHGIPLEDRILEQGDILSLDLGLSYEGYFVDSALTVCVGEGDAAARKLIDATREATTAAINAVRVGGHIGDIGAAVEEVAARYRFSIVKDLGGHAVGKAVHEHPYIPNEGVRGEGECIVEGMVLAIEPMLSEGKGDIMLDSDEWTYRMRDGSRAAHFEHTIVVLPEGPEILTK